MKPTRQPGGKVDVSDWNIGTDETLQTAATKLEELSAFIDECARDQTALKAAQEILEIAISEGPNVMVSTPSDSMDVRFIFGLDLSNDPPEWALSIADVITGLQERFTVYDPPVLPILRERLRFLADSITEEMIATEHVKWEAADK